MNEGALNLTSHLSLGMSLWFSIHLAIHLGLSSQLLPLCSLVANKSKHKILSLTMTQIFLVQDNLILKKVKVKFCC